MVAISAAIQPPKPSPTQVTFAQPTLGQQRLIDDGDVAHVAEPRRPRGLVIARMVGRQHREARRERLVERGPVGAADIVVQHQKGRSRAAGAEMQGGAGDGDGFLRPADRLGGHVGPRANGSAVPDCERVSFFSPSNVTRSVRRSHGGKWCRCLPPPT